MKRPANYPLISIITVCRNARAHLEQTIASVLSQQYPHLEYIIIDGASTDGTADLIRQYESRLAYWHTRPDRGLAHAFNLGLARARGDWLLYLNADDFFVNPAVVQQAVPCLQRHCQADVVYGQVEIIPSGPEDQPFPFPRLLGRDWSWQIFRFYNIIPHQAAFTNRRYFARVGNFDEQCLRSVDYEHYLRGGRNLQAVFVPVTISKMRLGGLSNRQLVRSLLEYKKAQVKNQALSPGAAFLNYYYRIVSYYGRRFLQKFTS